MRITINSVNYFSIGKFLMMSPYNYLVTVILTFLKDFFSVYGGRISCLASMIFFAGRSMPKGYLVTEALAFLNMFLVIG